MKKTTTRLATIGTVIVLGAFAIALAQHDSRNRTPEMEPLAAKRTPAEPIPGTADFAFEGTQSGDGSFSDRAYSDSSYSNGSYSKESVAEAFTQEAQVHTVAHTKPSMPFAEDDGYSPIVRGNNDGLDAPPLPALPSANAFPGSVASSLAFSDLPNEEMEGEDNPLRDSRAVPKPEVADASGTSDWDDSEFPEWDNGDVQPAAFQDGQANGAASLPAWNQDPPSLPNLGGNNFPAANAPPPSNSGAPVAGFPAAFPTSPPSANTAVAAGTPSIPQIGSPTFPSSGATAQPGLPNSTRTTSDMSDTQRGAMQPTDLTARPSYPPPSNLPPNNLQPNNLQPNVGATAAQPTNYSAVNSPAATPNPMVAQSLSDNSRSSFGNASAMSQTDRQRAVLVSSRPGDRYLDGAQAPNLVIHKRAPEEISVGKIATFSILVRNTGNTAARNVVVLDSVPQGVQFQGSTPAVRPDSAGVLRWELGDLDAGAERSISFEIIPEVQGEVGSVASVQFEALASVRTIATKPVIEIQIEQPDSVLLSGNASLVLNVANSGTGEARNLAIEADIAGQLQHSSGDALLKAVIPSLPPGASTSVRLQLAAVQPGVAGIAVRAILDNTLQFEENVDIEVVAPELSAAIDGPSKRYLERQASYTLKVANRGTAMATNLAFDIHLPAGLKYATTDIPKATYHPETHTVSLDLLELPPGTTAPIKLTVLPIELGPQEIKLNVRGDLNISAEAKAQVVVDGLADLQFAISQDNGTVEVGATSTYTVNLQNAGSKPDSSIRLIAQLPPGAELINVNAPVNYQMNGQQVSFAPIAEMRAGDMAQFQFEVRHNAAGNQVVRTQITSANWPAPVTKEEGTLVYNDQN